MVIVLLIASVILIANTIRLSIFSRRREIEVMKLVGATNWFVRGPFMLEGLLCGLVGIGRRGLPALPRQGDRAARDPRAHRHDRRRAGALLRRHRARADGRRPRRRSARLRHDAPPLPEGLARGDPLEACDSALPVSARSRTSRAVAEAARDRLQPVVRAPPLPSLHARRTQTGTRPGEAPEPLGAPPARPRRRRQRRREARRGRDRDHAARAPRRSPSPSSPTSGRRTPARPTTRSRC